MTESTERRSICSIYECSLQKEHAHGHTLDVMIVATGGGPHPQLASSGWVAACGDGGSGQSVRSIRGQSSIRSDGGPSKIFGNAAGSRTRSTITFSPGPLQTWS